MRHRTKEGFTVLEIGGGIGALQIELLRDGASVAERVERRVGDVLADPSSVAPADAVILQRVVCCYPHAEGLVRLAAQRARRVLVLTFPVDRW